MIFRRCPKCRTLCDAERDRYCFACGATLAAAAPNRPAAAVSRVAQEVRRDHQASNVVGLISGTVMAAFVILFMLDGNKGGVRILFAAIVLAGGAALTGSLLAKPGTPFHEIGRGFLKVLAVLGIIAGIAVACLIALLIFFFISCAKGGFR